VRKTSNESMIEEIEKLVRKRVNEIEAQEATS